MSRAKKRPKYISLVVAAGHPYLRNPRTNEPAHLSTMMRRIIDGITCADGTVVKLQAVRFPDAYRTRLRWIREFKDAINAHSFTRVPPPTQEQAEQELAAAGI